MMRGLAFWWEGDTRLSYAHPPAANAIYAAPGALMLKRYPIAKRVKSWKRGRNSFREYAEDDYPAMRAQLMAGRTTGVILAGFFFAYFYLFCMQYFGWFAAISSLALLAFNPSVMGNAALFTTDFPLMAILFIVVGEAIRWVVSDARFGFVRFGLVAGLALATKYSALPVVALLTALALAPQLVSFGRAWWGKSEQTRNHGKVLLKRLGALAAAGTLMLTVVNASHLFAKTGWSVERILNEPEISFKTDKAQQTLESTPIGKLPKWLHLPLPFTYVMGVGFVYSHARYGHDSWFMGTSSRTGNRLYYPTLLLIKTPLPLLGLLLAALPLAVLRWRRASGALIVMVALPLLLFASLTRTQMNIGLRHALPIVAMLTVVGGVAANALLDYGKRLLERHRALGFGIQGSVVAVLAAAFVPPFTEYPEYVGYFNGLVGRQRGHEISIVAEDWGQDVVFLAELAKEQKLKPLYYGSYSVGKYELGYFRTPFRALPCDQAPMKSGWVAVHRTNALRKPECYAAVLAHSKLTYNINEHIYVYRYMAAKRR